MGKTNIILGFLRPVHRLTKTFTSRYDPRTGITHIGLFKINARIIDVAIARTKAPGTICRIEGTAFRFWITRTLYIPYSKY